MTDIFGTNVPLPPKAAPGHVELVQGTKKWGITPARFAPGRVSVADFAPLVKLVEGK